MSGVLGSQWDRLYSAVHSDGGFSVDSSGKSPTSGYMVANVSGEERTPVSEFRKQHVADFAERNRAALSKPGAHHGAWLEDGTVYQDVSHHHENWGKAYAHTITNSQQAMYDVGGTGAPDTNPAYQHGLVSDPLHRQRHSLSRMSGANVAADPKSVPEGPKSPDWFSKALPIAALTSRRRGPLQLRALQAGASERAS